MLVRLLLILSLVANPLTLTGASAQSTLADRCVETSCCRIVETTSCCGTTVREMRCGRTGGRACLCAKAPGDSEPTPPAPRPSDRSELLPLAAAPLIVIEASVAARSQDPPAALVIVRSHGEARALLCIWRT